MTEKFWLLYLIGALKREVHDPTASTPNLMQIRVPIFRRDWNVSEAHSRLITNTHNPLKHQAKEFVSSQFMIGY